MNWRRGFFRAWAVVSICWIGTIGGCDVYNWYNAPWRNLPDANKADPRCHMASPPSWCSFDPDAFLAGKPQPNVKEADLSPSSSLWMTLLRSIIPPAVLLLFGVALYWVGRGFR